MFLALLLAIPPWELFTDLPELLLLPPLLLLPLLLLPLHRKSHRHATHSSEGGGRRLTDDVPVVVDERRLSRPSRCAVMPRSLTLPALLPLLLALFERDGTQGTSSSPSSWRRLGCQSCGSKRGKSSAKWCAVRFTTFSWELEARARNT